MKHRRPEARRYSMWLKDSKDNNFIRETGMRCLMDHEVGTHYVSFNPILVIVTFLLIMLIWIYM